MRKNDIQYVIIMSIVLISLFSCVLLFQTTLADHQYLDECAKTTGINVTPDMLQKLHDANSGGTFDLNTIPEEMLCLPKCVLEKRNVIDEAGKISMENLKANMIMQHVPNRDTFLNCVEKIDKIASCNDIKKIIECRIEAQ